MFTTTKALRQAAAAAAHAERTPMIRFLGKRSAPASVDHTPQAHPASPTHELPPDFSESPKMSFSSYREQAQQHGPLAKTKAAVPAGAIGAHAGRELGSVEPAKGEVWDRSQLPKRFWRTQLSIDEIEAVELGGASLFS